MSAGGGAAVGCQVSGFHVCERRKAFVQWKKTSSTSTSRASDGLCPLTTNSSRFGRSVTSMARPLMRSVSLRPGTIRINPTCGLEGAEHFVPDQGLGYAERLELLDGGHRGKRVHDAPAARALVDNQTIGVRIL